MPGHYFAPSRLAGPTREQEGFGQDRIAPVAQVQRLVLGVGARVGVLHPGDEDVGLREGVVEVGDEGDGPAHSDVDRRTPPGPRPGPPPPPPPPRRRRGGGGGGGVQSNVCDDTSILDVGFAVARVDC